MYFFALASSLAMDGDVALIVTSRGRRRMENMSDDTTIIRARRARDTCMLFFMHAIEDE